jgi:hypothetical protein
MRPFLTFSKIYGKIKEKIGRRNVSMTETEYSRRLDASGRLVIPSKLREELCMEVGDTYTFYT